MLSLHPYRIIRARCAEHLAGDSHVKRRKTPHCPIGKRRRRKRHRLACNVDDIARSKLIIRYDALPSLAGNEFPAHELRIRTRPEVRHMYLVAFGRGVEQSLHRVVELYCLILAHDYFADFTEYQPLHRHLAGKRFLVVLELNSAVGECLIERLPSGVIPVRIVLHCAVSLCVGNADTFLVDLFGHLGVEYHLIQHRPVQRGHVEALRTARAVRAQVVPQSALKLRTHQ